MRLPGQTRVLLPQFCWLGDFMVIFCLSFLRRLDVLGQGKAIVAMPFLLSSLLAFAGSRDRGAGYLYCTRELESF